MKISKQVAAALLAVVLLGVVNFGQGQHSLNFVAGYEPQFGPRGGVPFTGEMQLNFNDGIISGWYRDTSIRPGAPISNTFRTPVSGGTSGSNIHFGIGTGTRAFTVTGTIDQFGSISGSARSRGSARSGTQIWAFQAMVKR